MRRLLVAVLLVVPFTAHAQTRKIELTVGAAASGAASAGTATVELLGSGGAPVTLFEAAHRTSVGLGADAALMYRVRQSLALELSGSWTRPDLETGISDDVEGAGDTTLSLGMHRFSAEVAAVRHFGRRGGAEPYVRAGAGWFRELTSDRALVDDGVAGHVGAGVKYWLRERPGVLGHLAFRADVRLAARRGGIDRGEAGIRWSPGATVGLVIAR